MQSSKERREEPVRGASQMAGGRPRSTALKTAWRPQNPHNSATMSSSSSPGPSLSNELRGLTIVKRSGKVEKCQFDKITARISKLAYGLNVDFCDPVRLRGQRRSTQWRGGQPPQPPSPPPQFK